MSLGHGVVPIFFHFECTNSIETMKSGLVLRRPKNLSCSLSHCPQYCPWHQSKRAERKRFSGIQWGEPVQVQQAHNSKHAMSWYELNLAHLAPLWARGGEARGRELEDFLRLGFRVYSHSSFDILLSPAPSGTMALDPTFF